MKNYYVTVTRFGCGRLYATYRLGPFHSCWWARFKAWLERFGRRGDGWSQEAQVEP